MVSPFGYTYPPQRPFAPQQQYALYGQRPSATAPLAGAAIPGMSASAPPGYSAGGYRATPGNDMMPNPATSQVPTSGPPAPTPYEQWRQSWLKNNFAQMSNGINQVQANGPNGYLASMGRGATAPAPAPASNWTPPPGVMPVTNPQFSGIPQDLARKGWRRLNGPDGKPYWVPPGVNFGPAPGYVLH